MVAKILIVEDEVLIAEYIKDMLVEGGYKNLELAHDKDKAIEKMETYIPDIILMDINLSGINSGIDLAKQKNSNSKVIFLTGQYDYDLMSKALETNPESYLTKPIKRHDLIAAINLVLVKSEKDTYTFRHGYDTVNLKYSDILYFHANGNYVDIITKNQKFTIRQSLRKIISELPENSVFSRIHRAYLVNKNCITKVTSNIVVLEQHELPLGRAYAKSIVL